ncbi:MAG: hypothetical protein AAF998_02220 [Bacteroidota bacterium]
MRNLFVLLALVPCFLTAFGQSIALKKEYPNATFLKEAIPIADGYLVAGYRSRIEKQGNAQMRYYSPFVARLDAKMKTRWEKKFPESKYWPLRSIVAANGGYYVLGDNGFVDHNGAKTARLIKLSPEGRIVFEKLYPYPGMHSGEGVAMVGLPNGDLLARIDLFSRASAVEAPRILRLNARGEKIWDRPLLGDHFKYYPQRFILDHRGRLVLVGVAYRSREDFNRSRSRGWVRVIDPEHPTKIIAERFYDEFKGLEFTDAMELSSGGWWILGNAHDDKYGARRYAVLLELDANGKVIEQRRYEHEHQLALDAFCWNPKRNQLVMVGRMMERRSPPRSAMYTVDQNWDLKRDTIGDPGFYHQVSAFDGGELFVVKQKGLMVME